MERHATAWQWNQRLHMFYAIRGGGVLWANRKTDKMFLRGLSSLDTI